MGRAKASIEVPGLASDAEALWYDAARWPTWMDGLKRPESIRATPRCRK